MGQVVPVEGSRIVRTAQGPGEQAKALHQQKFLSDLAAVKGGPEVPVEAQVQRFGFRRGGVAALLQDQPQSGVLGGVEVEECVVGI